MVTWPRTKNAIMTNNTETEIEHGGKKEKVGTTLNNPATELNNTLKTFGKMTSIPICGTDSE